jgi:hypothetical protein
MREICCDVCGYPRTGLPRGVACPECGSDEPAIATARYVAQPMTMARRRWLRTVLAGLLLLVISSVATLQTALIMPIASVTISAVNVPAPKVGIAALVQRSIGDKPGEWGVYGTLGVLATLVAVWLLTEPENPQTGGLLTLAGVTRWGCILCAGAIFGLLLSFNEIFLSRNGSVGRWVLCTAVAIGELPANLLLYLYLNQLAAKLENLPARRLLMPCAFAIPLMTVGSLGAFAWAQLPDPVRPVMRIPVAVFVAGAVGVGVAATVGLLYLIQPLVTLALGDFIATTRHGLLRLPRLRVAIVKALNDNTPRWCALAGVALWLGLTAQANSISLRWPFRQALGGDIPAINFPGPKVVVGVISRNSSEWYAQVTISDVLTFTSLQLLALWLMTVPMPGTSSPFRALARWSAVLIGGAALGWGLSADLLPRQDNALATDMQFSVVMTILQAPATMLLYWHLSRIAQRVGSRRHATKLWWVGIAAAILTVVPAMLVLKPVYWLEWRYAVRQNLLMAPLMAVEVAAGLVAFFAVGRLGWLLVTKPFIHAPGTIAAAYDRTDADPAPE